jgi:hypothetical protein
MATKQPTPSDLVQGTLHMLILKTLALEPMHGYGIGVRLEQISRGVFQVNAGSLFPGLRRLERDGLIAGEWRDRPDRLGITGVAQQPQRVQAHLRIRIPQVADDVVEADRLPGRRHDAHHQDRHGEDLAFHVYPYWLQ